MTHAGRRRAGRRSGPARRRRGTAAGSPRSILIRRRFISPPPACSCRPRHNKILCRPASWHAEQIAVARRRSAPGRHRSIGRRVACPLHGIDFHHLSIQRIARKQMAVGGHDQRQRPSQQARLASRAAGSGAVRARRRVVNGDDPIANSIRNIQRAVRAKRQSGRADQERISVGRAAPKPSAMTVWLTITGGLPSGIESSKPQYRRFVDDDGIAASWDRAPPARAHRTRPC